jgi:MoxR-like ATPase
MNQPMQTIKTFQVDQSITLDPYAKWQKSTPHTFSREEAIAVLAALAIKRPLLVRGEPGCGKTQLARAAAQVLKMPMAMLVVNERTETEDLFWQYDALARLSDANDPNETNIDNSNYLTPGPLWWALNWTTAEKLDEDNLFQPDLAINSNNPRDPANGVLLLIDEIDKADRSVPNSLLEALDDFHFPVPCIGDKVCCKDEKDRPLIIITTNDEQQLPQAFVRRCLVLDIVLPTEKDDFVQTLTKRGEALFQEDFQDKELCRTVAEMLWDKRKKLQGAPYLPGQAEYLDHLVAIQAMQSFDPDISEQDAIQELAKLTYAKNN